MKEQLLESRLEEYSKNREERSLPCKRSAAFLYTASAAAGLGALICPPPAESAVQYSGLQSLPLGTEAPLPATKLLDLDGDAVDDFAITFRNISYNQTVSSLRAHMEQNFFDLHFPAGNGVIASQSVISSHTLSLPGCLPGDYTIQGSLPASAGHQWQSTSPQNFLALKMRQVVQYWSTAGNITSTVSAMQLSAGKFNGKTGYLGVRFQISTETHYGWIRFAADEDNKNSRILDWAYEDQPDTPIKAGAGIFPWDMLMPAILSGANKTP